ncbi:DUF58 domain-containing protein [Vibrio tapetis subsp. quintayensis]|uniref:DUF58 domain-containing protein n=1 Tax=Vibrio tapetis TaxID=52443 RepID=UPI0025B295D6|nr:DUF58 domain-containing protein [Vibrio tapetis]MDN3683024.1 DUF58 domain-containing protein [Vibrio tapetis subsp. quintayensis]
MTKIFSNQTNEQAPSDDIDSRICCSYKQLVPLQSQAQSFSLLPHISSGTSLAGRQHSLFRGRGLNFEELKHYQPGDDVRNIDWKTTMRVGKPYVRSYTEEKDRNVIVLADLRSGMFFSSQSVMKSVVVAEVTALCGWKAIKQGDRVGFVLATPKQIQLSRSCRSQNDLLHRLSDIAKATQHLNCHSSNDSISNFSNIIKQLIRLNLRSSTLILISDWHDASERDLDALKYLQQRNDVVSVLVSDPLELKLPERLHTQPWVIGNGEQQMNISGKALVSEINQVLEHSGDTKRNRLRKLMTAKKLPFIELGTSGNHLRIFKQKVGGRT